MSSHGTIRKLLIHLRRRLHSLRIWAQADDVNQIYNMILDRTPIASIKKEFHNSVSREVLAILDRMNATGYLPHLRIAPPVRISVIIPHYNQTQWLNMALIGIKAQTEQPHEVIVVDDLSEDFAAVQGVCSRHGTLPGFQLLRSPTKLFPGPARQYGADHSSGNILMMHDADDVSHPDRVRITRMFFEEHPDALHLTVGLAQGADSPQITSLSSCQWTISAHLIRPFEILERMRQVFVAQNFSKRISGCIYRNGCYGIQPPDPRTRYYTSAGHIAYSSGLAQRLKWQGTNALIPSGFTDFEDYEFNFLLLLLGQQSYQIDLPLIQQRPGTTTNRLPYWNASGNSARKPPY